MLNIGYKITCMAYDYINYIEKGRKMEKSTKTWIQIKYKWFSKS
jgi:hypothetical protein